MKCCPKDRSSANQRKATSLTWVVVITVAIMAVGHAGTAGAGTSFSISLTQTDLTPGEALLLGAAGVAFGLDTDVLLKYHSRSGTSEGAVTVAYTSQEGTLDADVILQEREQGRSWEVIADRHQIPPGLQGKPATHPGKANHLAKQVQGQLRAPDPYEVSVTLRFLAQHYGLDESTLVVWIEAGLTLEDVALTLNLAAQRQVDPNQVVELRLGGKPWEHLAVEFAITLGELSTPVPPAAQAGPPGHAGGHPGKGKGK